MFRHLDTCERGMPDDPCSCRDGGPRKQVRAPRPAAKPTAPAPAPKLRLPSIGDVYDFNGLPGGEGLPDGRTVLVQHLTVGGDVVYKIGFLGNWERRLHSAPLPNVLAMIQHSVWTLSQDQ